MALTKQSMDSFDIVWAEPSVARFGLEGQNLYDFYNAMI